MIRKRLKNCWTSVGNSQNNLTGNEGIPCVTAWCAAENTGSQRVLEKAGMRCVNTEKDGLAVGDRVYDKLIYEYRG